jgi:hypothetical protein
MISIHDYATASGLDESIMDEVLVSVGNIYADFSDWPVDSNCGKECQQIIILAAPLLAVADPVAHASIWCGLIKAMAAVCVG